MESASPIKITSSADHENKDPYHQHGSHVHKDPQFKLNNVLGGGMESNRSSKNQSQPRTYSNYSSIISSGPTVGHEKFTLEDAKMAQSMFNNPFGVVDHNANKPRYGG